MSKPVFKPKTVQTEGQAKAMSFSEQLNELKKDLLKHTISTDQTVRPFGRRLDAMQEALSAIVDILGEEQVAKRLDERRILRLEVQDQARQEHITQMLEQKRIETEDTVRGPSGEDMGSFISVVEFPPGGSEEPIPGSFTFMPIGAGNPKELLAQFVGQQVGFEVVIPNIDPETREPAKDDKGNVIPPGRLILLGIYKAAPPPEAKPEEPAVPAPAPDAPPAPEAAEAQAPEATA